MHCAHESLSWHKIRLFEQRCYMAALLAWCHTLGATAQPHIALGGACGTCRVKDKRTERCWTTVAHEKDQVSQQGQRKGEMN